MPGPATSLIAPKRWILGFTQLLAFVSTLFINRSCEASSAGPVGPPQHLKCVDLLKVAT